MTLIDRNLYPQSEHPQLDALESLFTAWQQSFAEGGLNSAEMVFDGFYPYYFSQKVRMLFLGWEPYELSGFNYLERHLGHYKSADKRIGERPLNQSKFHRLLLCITYGIQHGKDVWEDIPEPDKIADTFATAGGVSFAFMNVSKLSNETGSTNAEKPQIAKAFARSVEPGNFIAKQISILQPHVVVAMNLDLFGSTFQSGLGELKWKHELTTDDLGIAELNSLGHRSLLLHTHHFAARKSDDRPYYQPIRQAIHDHLPQS